MVYFIFILFNTVNLYKNNISRPIDKQKEHRRLIRYDLLGVSSGFDKIFSKEIRYMWMAIKIFAKSNRKY